MSDVDHEPRPPDRPALPFAAAMRILDALASPEEAAPTPHAARPGHQEPSQAAVHSNRIPGYIIVERIGAGGGGTVYRAFREGSDMPVALKVLDRHVSEPFAAQPEAGSAHREGGHRPHASARAWRELQMLADVRLPCVPRLLDFGTHEGHLFFATEFVEGLTLARCCEASRLGLRERVELLARLAKGVQSLHDHGVLHRDIKPSNALVTPAGDVVILDLGIAAALTPDGRSAAHTLTEEGQPIGTPAFMAPEQARGERSRISVRTDVYGLGATAYSAVVGSTPHDCETCIHEAIRRVSFEPPRDPRDVAGAKGATPAPAPLALVLMRACAQRPEDRYSSAGAFAEDLCRWLRGEPVEAQAAGAWHRATRWMGKHPKLTTLAACGIIVSLSAVATMVGYRVTLTRPFEIRLAEQGHRYELLSLAGVPQHSWLRMPSRRQVDWQDDVIQLGRAREFGGGWIAAALASDPSNPDVDEQLSIWDPHNLDRPIWTTSSQDFLPPSPFEPDGSTYRVNCFLAADVFEESPGLELIAIHKRSVSPDAVRVYDVTGRVLFHAWHWGAISDIYWIPDPSVLVVTGMDNSTPWRSLGHEREHDEFPRVVFAVRPTRGIHGLFNGPARDEGAGEVWRKYPWPRDAHRQLRFRFAKPTDRAVVDSVVNLTLDTWVVGADGNAYPNANDGGVWFWLDANGTVVRRGVAGPWLQTYPALAPAMVEFLPALPRGDAR